MSRRNSASSNDSKTGSFSFSIQVVSWASAMWAPRLSIPLIRARVSFAADTSECRQNIDPSGSLKVPNYLMPSSRALLILDCLSVKTVMAELGLFYL